MTLDDYFHHITSLIIRFSFLYSFSLELDKRTPYIGLVRGNLYFIDGSALFFREFLNVESEIVRLMYVYHYQDSDGKLIFRYDNAPIILNWKASPIINILVRMLYLQILWIRLLFYMKFRTDFDLILNQ